MWCVTRCKKHCSMAHLVPQTLPETVVSYEYGKFCLVSSVCKLKGKFWYICVYVCMYVTRLQRNLCP